MILLAGLSGVLSFFSFPPFSLWPLIFFAFAPFFIFLCKETRVWRVLFGTVLWAAISYSAFAFRPGITYVFDYILGWAVFALVWHFIRNKPRFLKGETPIILASAAATLSFQLALSRFAPLPAYVFMPGVPLAGTFFANLASVGGVLGISVFVIIVNILVALFALSFHVKKEEKSWGVKHGAKIYAGLVAVLLFAGFAANQLLEYKKPRLERWLSVAVVGTGIDFAAGARDFDLTRASHGLPLDTDVYFEKLFNEIRKRLGEENYDLIVFPEYMINTILADDTDKEAVRWGITNNGALLRAYASLALERRTNVLANLTTVNEKGEKLNSSVMFGPDGSIAGAYEKHYLAMGGEYKPFHLNSKKNKTGREKILEQEYVRGRNPLSPLLIAGVSLGVSICLENHLPSIQKKYKESGANILVHQSSNKWLKTPNAVYDAFTDRLRRLEAIHTGLPILVSERNGPAGIVQPDGSAAYVVPPKDGVAVYRSLVRY